jgi:hypothetical protein
LSPEDPLTETADSCFANCSIQNASCFGVAIFSL